MKDPAKQLEKLNQVLAEITQSNPFYRQKLQNVALSLPLTDLSEFFAKVPFTTKAELVQDQLDHPVYGSNLTYPFDRYTRFSQTSGTTGTPLRWLDTPESWTWMVDNWVKVFETADAKPGAVVFFAFSFGPFLGFWVAFEAAQKMACLCIPAGGMTSVARVHAIIDNGVDILCCTPTYAIRLGEVAAEEGIDLGRSQVRAIIAAGEPGASIPATRARITSLWPAAEVIDHHGMTEIGPVSYQCAKRDGVLHIIEESFIPEIIDPDTGDPVEPGQEGELVLTNLGRLGSPILRYRTGDLVKGAKRDRCACGENEMAIDGGILGRCDDMTLVRGVNIYPSAIEKVIRDFSEVAEYRVEVQEQHTMVELEVQIEAKPDARDPASLCDKISKALNLAFSLRIPVTLAPANSLPRFEMKARRWIKVTK